MGLGLYRCCCCCYRCCCCCGCCCCCCYAHLYLYLRRAAGRGGDEATEEHLAHSAHREVDAARRACNHTRGRR